MNKRLLVLGVLASSYAASTVADTSITASGAKPHVSSLTNNGAALRLGFANTQEVMRVSKAGEQASKDLESKRNMHINSLQKDEQALKKAATDFGTKSGALSKEAVEAEQKKLIKMERDYKGKVEEAEVEMKIAMQKTMEVLGRELEEAAKVLVERENLDALIDTVTGRVIYAKDNVMYNDKLVQNLNKQHDIKVAQSKVKAPAAKTA